ncbi:MAG: hypothetical protein M1358_13645 [Chloroflexi bacterium]|nr:hypothetical protein [Chloroflexota bacterium]
MRINNLDVRTSGESEALLRVEPDRKRRTTKIFGSWNLDETKPQSEADIRYENGEALVAADHSIFVGGGARHVAPFQYWGYAFTGCYAASLATVAAEEGV